MRQGNYNNGYKDGLWQFFNEDNGVLYAEVTFKKNKKNGIFREYNENGIVVSEGNFLNDIKDGIWKEYNSSGTITKKEFYNEGKLITNKLK